MKLRRLVGATAAAATIGLVGLPAVTHAQEAPAAPVTLPCNITNWLKRGMRDSDDVRCLQQVLTNLQIPTGPVDGYLGPITQGAVEAFQASKGLNVDGAVGPETAQALAEATVDPTTGVGGVAYSGPTSDPTPPPPPAPKPAPKKAAPKAQTVRTTSARSSSTSTRSSGSSGGSGVNWDAVAHCESGGQWGHGQVTNSVGTFSGGLMIMNSAWRQFGGTEFAPTAGQASRGEQIIVAERIAARVGAARAWQCPTPHK